MDFRHAYFEMLSGRAVRLPDWSGYWAWENGTIMMHSKDSSALDIRHTQNPGYTFTNIASEPRVLTTDEWKARNGGKHD